MTKYFEALTCTLLALGLAACGAGDDTTAPGEAADQARALSFADAIASAQEQVPEGIPYEVEIERVEGRDVIEVELFVGDIVREVHLDLLTGEVISVVDETDGEQSAAELEQQAALSSAPHLGLAEAVEIAERESGGEVLEVEYKVVEGALIAEVEVQEGEETSLFVLDLASGELRAATLVEEDEELDED